MRKSIKPFTSVLLVVVIMISVLGCGVEDTPEGTIENFFSAVQKYDKTKMMKELSHISNDKNKEKFTRLVVFHDALRPKTMENGITLIIDLTVKNRELEYFIVKTEMPKEDRATVTVKLKYVDSSSVMKKVYADYLNEVAPSQDQGYWDIFNRNLELSRSDLNEGPRAYIEKTLEIDCQQKDGRWYISDFSDELAAAITGNMAVVPAP